MLRGGLRPILGILVVIIRENKSGRSMPCKLRPQWANGGPGISTHQEHQYIDPDPAGTEDTPDGVYLKGDAPPYTDRDVIDIWGSETCPPLAIDGILVHGGMLVTAFFIPPSRYEWILHPATPEHQRDRGQWARSMFDFIVSGLCYATSTSVCLLTCSTEIPPVSIHHERCHVSGAAILEDDHSAVGRVSAHLGEATRSASLWNIPPPSQVWAGCGPYGLGLGYFPVPWVPRCRVCQGYGS